MSLFGIIPIQEIKELAQKCEIYSRNFLEDKNEGKGLVISEPNIREELIDQNQGNDKKENEKA